MKSNDLRTEWHPYCGFIQTVRKYYSDEGGKHEERRNFLTAGILCSGVACSSTYNRPPVREAYIGAANIKEVESVLQRRGYKPGPVDGNMDSQTEQAIRAFQRDNNLKVTGVLDVPTTERLQRFGANFTGKMGQIQQRERSQGQQ